MVIRSAIYYIVSIGLPIVTSVSSAILSSNFMQVRYSFENGYHILGITVDPFLVIVHLVFWGISAVITFLYYVACTRVSLRQMLLQAILIYHLVLTTVFTLCKLPVLLSIPINVALLVALYIVLIYGLMVSIAAAIVLALLRGSIKFMPRLLEKKLNKRV